MVNGVSVSGLASFSALSAAMATSLPRISVFSHMPSSSSLPVASLILTRSVVINPPTVPVKYATGQPWRLASSFTV